MAQDLKSMSKKQLEKLKKDVEKALASIVTKEKREAKKAAEKVAAKFGFSLADLTGGVAAAGKPAAKAPKKSSPPKYVNPQDPKQTWTGKGRQPQWFKDAIASGTAAEALEI